MPSADDLIQKFADKETEITPATARAIIPILEAYTKGEEAPAPRARSGRATTQAQQSKPAPKEEVAPAPVRQKSRESYGRRR